MVDTSRIIWGGGGGGRLGEKNRHIGCTNMNEKSSRLHTMFRMVSVIILRYFNLKILTTD